jgi:septum formation protein
MKVSPKIVLASSSPFRRVLLKKICPLFECASADIDESQHSDETPISLSTRLANEKAHALTQRFPNHLIIGSDQVAMLGDTQLHKPGNAENSIAQLERSSGQKIVFYTSVCVLNSESNEYKADIDTCSVKMKPLTLSEIEQYVSIDKPYGCAAAFKSEGLGIALFEKIKGDDPNALVGLPLIKLIKLLGYFDYKVL